MAAVSAGAKTELMKKMEKRLISEHKGSRETSAQSLDRLDSKVQAACEVFATIR